MGAAGDGLGEDRRQQAGASGRLGGLGRWEVRTREGRLGGEESGSGEKVTEGEKKRGVSRAWQLRCLLSFLFPSPLASLFFFSFSFVLPGSIGMFLVLLGLGSQRWENCQCVRPEVMLCCTPVRPKWFRSGAVGCEVGGATRAIDRRLDVGVVGAGAGGLFLFQKLDLTSGHGGKMFPALGWAGLGGTARPFPL